MCKKVNSVVATACWVILCGRTIAFTALGKKLFPNLFVFDFMYLLRFTDGSGTNSALPGCVESVAVLLALFWT